MYRYILTCTHEQFSSVFFFHFCFFSSFHISFFAGTILSAIYSFHTAIHFSNFRWIWHIYVFFGTDSSVFFLCFFFSLYQHASLLFHFHPTLLTTRGLTLTKKAEKSNIRNRNLNVDGISKQSYPKSLKRLTFYHIMIHRR